MPLPITRDDGALSALPPISAPAPTACRDHHAAPSLPTSRSSSGAMPSLPPCNLFVFIPISPPLRGPWALRYHTLRARPISTPRLTSRRPALLGAAADGEHDLASLSRFLAVSCVKDM